MKNEGMVERFIEASETGLQTCSHDYHYISPHVDVFYYANYLVNSCKKVHVQYLVNFNVSGFGMSASQKFLLCSLNHNWTPSKPQHCFLTEEQIL